MADLFKSVSNKGFDKQSLIGELSPISSIRKIVGNVTFDEYFYESKTGVCRLLLLNESGDVNFEWDDGTSTVVTLSSTGIYPISCTRILSADTTVSNANIYWGY